MKKVVVIGCGGSGKSVFSRSFAQITGLPLYHLDNIWWREDGTTITREEFDVGADIFQRGLCLPSDIKMTAEEQDVIIEIVRSCFE